MRISVPVTYVENVVPKRAQNTKNLRFGEWFDVEVQEVNDLEAPVIIEWRAHMHDRAYSAINDIVQLRYYDGHFYEAQVVSAAYEPNQHLTLEELIDKTAQGHYHNNPLLTSSDYSGDLVNSPDDYSAIKADEYRFVYSDERSKIIKELEVRASETIIVDGLIWTKTNEPVLLVKPITSFHSKCDFEVKIEQSAHLDNNNMKDAFRLDRLEDAIAYGKDAFGATEFSVEHDPQILRSEVLSYDDDKPALLNTLQFYIKGTENEVINESRDHVIAWYDMRTAIRALTLTSTDQEFEAVVNSVNDVLDTVSDTGFYEDRLRAAVNRWVSKPIDLDLSLNFGQT